MSKQLSGSRIQVVFCTNASLYSSILLEKMLASDAIDIIGIYLSNRVRTKTGRFMGDIFRIIKTSGLRYAVYLAMGTVVFELLRKNGSRPSVQSLAKRNNIDIFSSKDINSHASVNWLKDLAPGVLLSGFFNQKLGAEALSIASQASLNLHPALLPKYKGVDPVFYYFLNRENTVGITLHRMDTTYDTGEILVSQKLDIQDGRSVLWHNIELFKLGAALFIQWLEKLEDACVQSSVESSVENSAESSVIGSESEYYDSWPTPRQVKQLKHPLFSWKDFRDQAG